MTRLLIFMILCIIMFSCTSETDFAPTKENLNLVLIPSGILKTKFPYDYKITYIDQWTPYKVTLEFTDTNINIKAIYMMKYEVTEVIWDAVMGTRNATKSYFPVTNHSWLEIIDFCNKLSKLENLKPCYKIEQNDYFGNSVVCDFNSNGYRLPTMAEWEYCCRAGSDSNLYNGSLDKNNLDKIAWWEGNSKGEVHACGQKEPNNFGLYDMIGNVSEFCWDKLFPVPYLAEGDLEDYQKYRIYRGSSAIDSLETSPINYFGYNYLYENYYGIIDTLFKLTCELSNEKNLSDYPKNRFNYLGFRVVKNY
jgi:formylglycine-generating enzyme required for sulfatase activity